MRAGEQADVDVVIETVQKFQAAVVASVETEIVTNMIFCVSLTVIFSAAPLVLELESALLTVAG